MINFGLFFFFFHKLWAQKSRLQWCLQTSDRSVPKISTFCLKNMAKMHHLHRLPVFSAEKPKQQRLFRCHPTLFFFPSRPNRRCSMNRSADLVSAELFPSPSLLTHQERSCEDPKEGKPRWDTLALAHSHTSQPGLRRCVPPPPPFEPASCCRATCDQYDSHVSQHPSLLHCQEPAGWRRGGHHG